MRAAQVMAAVAVAGALGGCGGASEQDQVRSKVAQFVFGGVSSPSLSIGKITVAGSQASVIALSTAKG